MRAHALRMDRIPGRLRLSRLRLPGLAVWGWLLLSCSLQRPPSPPPHEVRSGAAVRYLALGDSFTIGTGADPTRSFPSRLAARWQDAGRGVVVRNLAVNGYTTQDLIDQELPEVRRFAPTFVTLAIGANDLVRGSDAAAYRAQVRRILAALLGDGVAAARLVALPQPDWSRAPVAAYFGARDETRGKIEDFNRILREETQAVGGRYIDLFPLMKEQAQAGRFAADGLHPSAAAYDEWAAALAEALPPASLAAQ